MDCHLSKLAISLFLLILLVTGLSGCTSMATPAPTVVPDTVAPTETEPASQSIEESASPTPIPVGTPQMTPSSTWVRPTPTPPQPSDLVTPTETPVVVDLFPSPDGSRQAFVRDLGTLVIQETDGQQRDLLTTQQISSLSWFPDGVHIVYTDYTFSGIPIEAKYQLMVVNVETGESFPIGEGAAPSVSPNGRYIAILAGIMWGDACFVGYDVAILELDDNLNVIASYHQNDFAGLPDEEDQEDATFYPTSIEGIEHPGVWETDTQLMVALRWACLPNDPADGIYLLDTTTLQANKIGELPAD